MREVKFLLFLVFLTFALSINKIYVLDLTFKGNHHIQKNEFEKLLRLKKKSFLSTTEFKSNKLNLDLITLQSYYKSKGYLDVKIDYSYDYVDESNVSIEFLIHEGIQYKLRNISIMGNKSFDDSYILKLIASDSDYYNPSHTRNKLLELKNEYLKIGKINISINKEIDKDDTFIDLHIYISEGNKFYIDNIIISGLENINERLVNREIIFEGGDMYNINNINRTKSYLFESQLFSSIEIFPYIESDTTVGLDIRLRELRSREIEFEFGFSQLPSNQGDLPISAINVLGNIDRSNVFNTATKLSFSAEYGFSYNYMNDSKFLRSYYELGLYSPWFITARIPFRFKIYSETLSFFDIDSVNTVDNKKGVIVYIENYRSSNPYLSTGVITEFFKPKNSKNRRSVYATYITHNIKNFIQPSNGYYLSINPRLSGLFLGGIYNYFKNDFEFRMFKNISNKIIFAVRAKAGLIYELGNSPTEIPEFDKFFLGGSSSLRGWESPEDYNNDVRNDDIGGLSRGLLNFEIRMPVYKMLGLEFFYDGGFIDYKNIYNNYNWNIGWGITMLSGLGPARIDFAFKEGKGKSTLQISLLNMF